MNEVEFDSGVEAHPPGLYQPGGRATGVAHLDAVGAEEVARYRNDGYLVVQQAFGADTISAVLAGLRELVLGPKPGFTGLQYEAQAKDALDRMSPEQRLDAVRRLSHFVEFEPRLKALSHDSRLISVVGRLLGDREPKLIQDMALLKPPHLGREKPWHQDHAFFDFPLGTPIVGVWIALDEATIENGCMQILPGRHRGGPMVHFRRRDWQICDTDILGTPSLAVPLAPGGVLFFDGLMPHGTPPNRTSLRRRALQFHYAPVDLTRIPTVQRLAIFGSEGKSAQC